MTIIIVPSVALAARALYLLPGVLSPAGDPHQKNVFSISKPPTKKTTSCLFKNKVLPGVLSRPLHPPARPPTGAPPGQSLIIRITIVIILTIMLRIPIILITSSTTNNTTNTNNGTDSRLRAPGSDRQSAPSWTRRLRSRISHPSVALGSSRDCYFRDSSRAA